MQYILQGTERAYSASSEYMTTHIRDGSGIKCGAAYDAMGRFMNKQEASVNEKIDQMEAQGWREYLGNMKPRK